MEDSIKNLLIETVNQLEYLNEKFGETGTTNGLIAKILYELDNTGVFVHRECPSCCKHTKQVVKPLNPDDSQSVLQVWQCFECKEIIEFHHQ